jgi:putative peptidoglycan lipid II flippase
VVNKLLASKSKTLAGAAIILGATSLMSRLLGLVRERMIAHNFGASDLTDIYYISFRLPDLVYNLLVLGAISSAFIPIFSGYLAKNEKKEAWRMASGVLNLLVLSLLVILVFLFIFAPWVLPGVINLFEKGGQAERELSAENIALIVKMTRLMLVSPLLLGISAIVGAILNSFKRFVAFSLAPIFYNLGIILGATLGVKFFGIFGLAYGVILGSLLHVLIQLPVVIKLGWKMKFWLDWKHEGVIKVLKLMGPRVLGLAINQVNLLVISFIALSLKEGSLTSFNYANNIQSFPLGVFAISFSVAAFPTLSALASKERMDKFIKVFSKAFRQIIFYLVPAGVLLLVLRAQIVRVVLGTGEFDWEDTIFTAQSLGFFALSLFAQGLIFLLVRSFYALKNTFIPFVAGLIGAVINVGLGLLFAARWGILGLVIAFSISSILQMLILLFILHLRLKDLDDVRIMRSVLKIGTAAFVGGLAAYLSLYLFVATLDISTRTFYGIFLQGLFAGVIGLLVYLGFALMIRSEEAIEFYKAMVRNFKKLFGKKA